MLDLGSNNGIVDKAGSWFSFQGERLGQGREGAKLFLKENPEIATQIRSLIMDSYGTQASEALPEPEESPTKSEDAAETSSSEQKKTKKKMAANS
jgi:recombination protein RecA